MKFWDRLTGLHKASVLIVAIMLAGWGAHAEFSYWTGQVAANTHARHIRAYDNLLRKYHAEKRLSTRDKIKFCAAAKELGIGGKVVRRLCK